MQKNTKIIILSIVLLFLFSNTCYASDIVEINQLVENAKDLNNTEITIQGELIGEALERGEYAFININDGTNAIGVWVKRSDINQMKFYGDYKHRGDIVKITGTFYNACSEHGGDFDIHCSNIVIVENGYFVKEEISHVKILATIVLAFIAILILGLYFQLMKLQIKKF